MELTNWIKDHNLISMSSLEKALGLSHGNLKFNKKIPDKYRPQIISILQEYGYSIEGRQQDTTSLEKLKPESKAVDIMKVYMTQPSYTYPPPPKICIKNKDGTYSEVDLPEGTELLIVEYEKENI